MKYPVITLWQPWAQWVALGWKTIETRTHNKLKSLVDRDVLIHAAQAWDEHALQVARPYLSAWSFDRTAKRDIPVFQYGAGHILAKAHVNGHRLLTYSSDPREALIECQTERFGLLLDGITMLSRFIPAQGKQGIWYWEGNL